MFYFPFFFTKKVAYYIYTLLSNLSLLTKTSFFFFLITAILGGVIPLFGFDFIYLILFYSFFFIAAQFSTVSRYLSISSTYLICWHTTSQVFF